MSFQLNGVSPELLRKFYNGLVNQGNRVSPEFSEGSNIKRTIIEGQGIRAQVDYLPSRHVALVMILSKPFYVPEALIEAKVRDALSLARSG